MVSALAGGVLIGLAAVLLMLALGRIAGIVGGLVGNGNGKFAEQQKMLSELMTKGASVIACPVCMKHYGVKDGDLMDGVKVGNPDMTSALLFKDGTQTLTW